MTTRELKPTRPQPACPECDKVIDVSKKSSMIGEFLEWLKNKTTFCEWDDLHERWEVGEYERMRVEQILAEYFGIDLDKVEQERRELLEWIQEQNDE